MPTSLDPLRGASAKEAVEKEETTPDLTRLPRHVLPKRYELKLTIFPEEFTYSGQVNIRIFVGDDPVNTVWLHAVRLSIEEATLQFSQFALPQLAEKIIEAPKHGCIGIHFKEALTPGTRAWLGIRFSGKISQNLEGFFSTPFTDKNGDVRLGAATMFAATEARTCFPCFDEPDLKAVFAIETTVDDDLQVISNMPIMDTRWSSADKKGKRMRTDYFEWSKEMSTYLVCLVIGQYDSLQTMADGRTKVRVFTPWGQREQGRFALEVTKRSLEFFNAYFGKRYPLPKLDMVALSRLSVGAMENWGLITCRETGLIIETSDATPAQLQKIATLIAHEVSHQWFGNLVTMKWWDFLYLNEGFATLMQYLCIDHIYPEFQVFNYFCTETFVPAMGMDALANSHPIEQPLHDPSEISQVFDKITYCKGASVLFMLHQFIGAEDFKTGIQNYLQEFSYGNATTEDLWKFLSSSSRKDVGSVMNSWIRELGFPVVKVVLEPPSGGDTNNTVVLKLRQERFSNCHGHDRALLWSIPLEGIYMKNGIHLETFKLMFDKKSADIKIEGFDVNDPACWIKINPKLTGFYRVHYCEELIHRLFENLDNPHLTAVDRMGLFDDQVAMVLSETGSTVRILRLCQKFRNYERSITVWRSVCGILHQIRTLTWNNEELADKFDVFCSTIFRCVLEHFGLHPGGPDEPSSDAQCRALLFSHLAAVGDAHVQAVAKDMFRMHVEGVAPIPACLREAVFRAVMVQANRTTFNQMKMLYRQAELAEERSIILNAIGYAKDPNILSQVLDFAISYEVPAQESLVTIVTVASNRHGHRLAWFFFTSNIEKILSRYSGGLFLLSRIIRAVTESFSDRDTFQEVTNFFASYQHKLVASVKSVQQAEEHIRLNMSWREKDIDTVRHFLDHNID